MLGWLADLFSAVWALIYWNARKTLFRWRRGRPPCPCQHPSDSGRGGETACDAARGWRQPRRFRHVCPLLRPNVAGEWRCSVDTPHVRPFWARALLLLGGGALALYLVLSGGAYAALRGIGYDVAWRSVVWPPAWHQVREARSRYFFDRARSAYQRGDFNAGLLSLAQAYQIDPRNYAAGRLLAQLWQFNRPALADGIYRRLLQDHPDARAETAQSWLRALLAHRNLPAVQELAAHAVRFDAAGAPAWMHALVFATRRTGSRAELEALLEDAASLPPGVATVAQLELTVRAAPAPATSARALETEPAGLPAEQPWVRLYRARRLIELGSADRALQVLATAVDAASERDVVALQLDAYATLDLARPRRQLIDRILRAEITVPALELLGAHLVRQPDPALGRTLRQALLRHPLPTDAAARPLHVIEFCVAGALGDEEWTNEILARLQRLDGSPSPALTAARDYFFSPPPRRPVEVILPLLQPLPLELTYALIMHHERPALPAVGP